MKSSELIPKSPKKETSPQTAIYNELELRIRSNCSQEQMVATLDTLKETYGEKNFNKAICKCNKNHQGNTLLHFAVLTGNSQHITPLVQAGIHVDSINVYGQTPLHLAARKSGNNKEAINTLISLGATKEKKCFRGHSAEYYCWRTSYNGARSFNGANAMEIVFSGMGESEKEWHIREKNNALHVVVSKKDTRALEQFLKGGKSTSDLDDMIFESNVTGFTPLQLTQHSSDLESLAMQKQISASVDNINAIARKHFPYLLHSPNEMPTIKTIRRREKDSYYNPGYKHKPSLYGQKLPETPKEKAYVIKHMIHAGEESPELRERLHPLIIESAKHPLTRDVVDYISHAGLGVCPPYQRNGKDKFLKVILPAGDSVFNARLDMKYALGVYTNKNTLFVGRDIDDAMASEQNASHPQRQHNRDRSVYGTIVHEGAHALCKAMYRHIQVYPMGNNERQKNVEQLLQDVQSEAEAFSKKAKTPEEKYISNKMNNYFSKNSQCYKNDRSKIAELATAIVTVAVKCGYEKTQEVLTNNFPKYNEFWHQTFLKDAREFMKEAKKKRSVSSTFAENGIHTPNKRIKLDDGSGILEQQASWASRVTPQSSQQRYC